MREYQVRFRERLRVKLPLPTRQWNRISEIGILYFVIFTKNNVTISGFKIFSPLNFYTNIHPRVFTNL